MKSFGIIFSAAKHQIARVAEDSSHPSRIVIMVCVPCSCCGVTRLAAYRALVVLLEQYRAPFFDRQSICSLEMAFSDGLCSTCPILFLPLPNMGDSFFSMRCIELSVKFSYVLAVLFSTAFIVRSFLSANPYQLFFSVNSNSWGCHGSLLQA